MTNPSRIGRFSSAAWWAQALVILGVGALVAQCAVGFVPATGPGCDLIFYVIMIGYSCFVFFLGTRTARVLGSVIAVLCLVGVLHEMKAKQDFHRMMEENDAWRPRETLSAECAAIDRTAASIDAAGLAEREVDVIVETDYGGRLLFSGSPAEQARACFRWPCPTG